MEFTLPLPQQHKECGNIYDSWNCFYSNYRAYAMSGSIEHPSNREMLSLFLYAAGQNSKDLSALQGQFSIEQLNRVLLTLETICIPNIFVLFERHKLFTCVQEKEEDAQSFIHKLQKRANTCDLGTSRDHILVNCLIEGLLSEDLKQSLRHITDLSFAKAADICQQQYNTLESSKPSIHYNTTGSHSGGKQFSILGDQIKGETIANDTSYAKSGLETFEDARIAVHKHDSKVKYIQTESFLSRHLTAMSQKSKYATKLRSQRFPVSQSQEMETELPPVRKKCPAETGCSGNIKSEGMKRVSAETKISSSDSSEINTSAAKGHKEFLSCEHCGETFKSPSLLNRHLVKHSQDKLYSCNICGHRLKRKAEVKVHMRKHTDQRDYKCSVCGFAFMRSDHLKVHMRTHSGEKPYTCDICQKTFAYLTSLTVHKNTRHGKDAAQKIYRYTCETCGKSFNQRTPFTNHLRIHSGEKPFPCQECGKCFSSNALLRQHLRIHTSELSFICDICGKRFRHNQNLHTHKRAHSGKRSYVCELCGASYLYIKNLKQHKKGVHGISVASRNNLNNGTNNFG